MSVAKVSVLIPCYNAEKYIGETLNSVFAQTWPNLEVIVVDDGSSDHSVMRVRTYPNESVRLIVQKNRGAAAARNAAFQASTGDYIQFLDADDLLSPDKIRLQVERLMNRPNCSALCDWGRFYVNPDDAIFEDLHNNDAVDPMDWLVRYGLRMLFPARWLISRSVATAAGPWDESLSLGDDTEYFTRIALASDCLLNTEGARSYYRSGLKNSLSATRTKSGWDSQFRVNALCQAHIMKRRDTEEVRRLFAITWQHLAHACYPYDPKLASAALKRAKDLHSVRIRPDGGVRFKILSRIFGWRVARRLQVTSGRP